jgi:hypothetical protein
MDYEIIKRKIQQRTRVSATGCWEWQGALGSGGYGVFSYRGKQVRAHRASLAAYCERPDILEPCINGGARPVYVLHSCDNPKCCNPDHLRLGTPQDNADDARSRNRRPEFITGLPRKLTDEQAIEVYAAAQTWDGMCDMMKKYRMSQSSVQDIASRRTYKHINSTAIPAALR